MKQSIIYAQCFTEIGTSDFLTSFTIVNDVSVV